jgi:hypothetical protein
MTTTFSSPSTKCRHLSRSWCCWILVAACSGDFGRLQDRAAPQPDAAAAGGGIVDPDPADSGAAAGGGRTSSGGVDAGGDTTSAAGGNSSSGGTGGQTSIGSEGGSAATVGSAESTMRQAKAHCANMARCDKHLMQQMYGSETTCVSRLRLYVEIAIQSPGVAYTDADRDACSVELENMSCEDFLTGTMGPTCHRINYDPGTLPDGAPCTRSLQCASGYCPMYTCGSTCSAKPAAGATCGLCHDEMYCAPNKTCAVPSRRGENCDDAHPCQFSLVCFHGTCTPLLAEGESCDWNAQDPAVAEQATTPPCDWIVQGLICLADKKCGPRKFAAPGEACGWQDGQTFFDCSDSGFCSESTPHKCLAHANEGETCNETHGPYCQFPAFCHFGKCEIVGEGSCK